MKQRFIDWKPRGSSAAVVTQAEDICREYADMGYNLTLRQLYYQFVARALVPNNAQSYKRLGEIVNNARLGGLLDWSYIEDRTRSSYGTDGWSTTPEDAINTVAGGYTLPRWTDQPYHVEAWVEKEALADVVQRAAEEVNIRYFACRGYVSQSEMYSAAGRLGRKLTQGKRVLILHLGDHDPSGIDMTRDITDRLATFGIWRDVEIRRIALNMDQVEEYNPPPNFAKVTDSRFADYQSLYGDDSWELDALEPQTMRELIVSNVHEVIDWEAWDAVGEREDRERELLSAIAEHYDDIVEYIESQEW